MTQQRRAQKTQLLLDDEEPIMMQRVRVTPTLALDWLGKNWDRNRYIRQARVIRYRDAMLAGNWYLTHQGIAFDMDGKLFDGQHRLSALAMIEKPIEIEMMVFYCNKPCGPGLEYIDVGASRTQGDSMTAGGLVERQYGNNVSATATMIWRGLNMTDGHPISPQIKATYALCKTEIDWAVREFPKAVAPVRAAFAYAYPCDNEKVSQMARTAFSRIGLQVMSPELALSNVLTGKTTRADYDRLDLFYITLQSLKHKLNGTPVARLQAPRMDGTVPDGMNFFSTKRRAMGIDKDPVP